MDGTSGKNFNSISRVYTILSDIVSSQPTAVAEHIWASVFDISSSDPLVSRHDTFGLVNLLYEEVRLAHEGLRSTSVPHDMYEEVFESLYNALDPRRISETWESTRRHLDGGVLKTFNVLSLHLPTDSIRLDKDELSDVKSQIADLEEQIKLSDFPSDVKAFFLSQLRIMSDAVRRYHIAGTKVFGTALALGRVGAIYHEVDNEEISEADKKQISDTWERITTLWRWCADRAGEASKIYALVDILRDNFPSLPG